MGTGRLQEWVQGDYRSGYRVTIGVIWYVSIIYRATVNSNNGEITCALPHQFLMLHVLQQLQQSSSHFTISCSLQK